jgi:hypothetical protein
VSQQEGDRDQPRDLGGTDWRDAAHEAIELVGDVQFFEEDVKEPTSPGNAV